MTELVSESQAHLLVTWFCVLLSATSLAAAAFLGFLPRRPPASRVRGAALGLYAAALGPYVFLLWRLYNAVEDALGLDSLKALAVNAALFAGAGWLAAHGLARVLGRLPAPARGPGSPTTSRPR